ncbi:MAG: sigma-70 family RNA polymerase sigma factor [Myxococcaceae bacterium]
MNEEARIFARTWQDAVSSEGEESARAFWVDASGHAADFGVTPRRFAEFIAARVKTEPELAAARPHAAELLLACACLDGSTSAMKSLDSGYLLPLRGALGSNQASHDDVLQHVREKLLMGSNPRLATYSGRGDLRRFLKAVAVRTMLDRNRGQREELVEETFFEKLTAASNPEAEALRARYRAEFKAAFAEALTSLPEREQLWLRQYHLDGVKLERLAAMHGVVASTVSRSLEKTRTALMKRVREALIDRGIGSQDVDSVLQLLGSRMSLPET